MGIKYEKTTDIAVKNTIAEKGYVNGAHKVYRLTPGKGYVLHDGRSDAPVYDETGEPTGEVMHRFCSGNLTVRYDYDFGNITDGEFTYIDENGKEEKMPVKMIGSYRFYALPDGIVPEGQVYNK